MAVPERWPDSAARADARLRLGRHVAHGVFAFTTIALAGAFAVAGATGRLEGREDLHLLVLAGIAEVGVSTYVVWGAYWGVPVVWQSWTRAEARIRQSPGANLLLTIARPTVIPMIALYSMLLAVALLYGTAGGGVREHVKNRRLARRI